MAKTVVSKTDETSVHKAQKTPNKIIQTKQHVGTFGKIVENQDK